MGFLLGKVFRFFLVIYVGVFCFFLVRPFPEQLEQKPVPVPVTPSSVTFLSDVTYTASSGAVRVEESIFPTMLSVVKGAKSFVYADMFLFNEFQGKEKQTFRHQTEELAQSLITKKASSTGVSVIFMTDPINRGYGGIVNPDLVRMEKAGILVYETPLDLLRDSNPLWSTIYRMFFRWSGNSTEGGWLPNPLDADGEKVTLRTYARLLNFKANHRKILVTDEIVKGQVSLVTLVGSLNPHTASSLNGNVALLVRSTALGQQALSSEAALFDLGKYPPLQLGATATATPLPDTGATATYLTEENIQNTIVKIIEGLPEDSTLDIAVFYLSDRHIIRAIEKAQKNNVRIRLLLDGNDSAFGKHKYGIPNRQTVERLMSKTTENLSIKWCNTHGEQCHAKMLLATGAGKTSLLVGSANYTRRNLDKYNLESAVLIESTVPMQAITSAHQYVERLWNNTKGETSLPVEAYRDRESWKRVIAWVMEYTGLSTF